MHGSVMPSIGVMMDMVCNEKLQDTLYALLALGGQVAMIWFIVVSLENLFWMVVP